MSLKNRVNNLEKSISQAEGNYYGEFWVELYEADPEAAELGEKIGKLVDESPIEVPFWYMQGKDEHLRRFCWLSRYNKEVDATLSLLLGRLKKFVKSKSGKRANTESSPKA